MLPGENAPKSAYLCYHLHLITLRKQAEEFSGSFMFTLNYFGIFPMGNIPNYFINRNSDLFPGYSSVELIPETII